MPISPEISNDYLRHLGASMKTRWFALASVLIVLGCPSLSQSQVASVLRNVNIVGLAGEADQLNREVLIQGNKILSVRATGNRPHGEARIIDCADKWLIPGLIDMRVSLHNAAADESGRQRDLQELLSSGVTSVLDLSGAPARVESAPKTRPRIFSGAAPVRGQAVSWSAANSTLVQNEKEARLAVQSAKKQGATLLFLDANLEAGAVKAALQEAGALGLLTAGAFLATSFEEAGKGGVNLVLGTTSVLSGFADRGERKKFSASWSRAEEALFSPNLSAEFFKAWQKADPQKSARRKLQVLANQAVFFAPLLALETKRVEEYAQTPEDANAALLLKKYRQLLRLAFDLQIPLLAASGYDAQRNYRPRLHEELEAWVAAGLEPRFALEAATINAGHALRQTNLGQIGEGMLADLVVLEEHPLKNLAALRRPWAVMADGNFFGQIDLAQLHDANRISEREIRAVLEWQVQAWNDGDLQRFMRGYWKNDSTLFASGGNFSKGWQEMLARYQRGYPTREKMGQLEFKIYKLEIMGEEWARVLGQWQLAVGATNPHGLFTLILRRFAEGWRIVHDHTSSAAP
jgi:ketosteroid isomerase-like protein